jgi:hypothetical protein
MVPIQGYPPISTSIGVEDLALLTEVAFHYAEHDLNGCMAELDSNASYPLPLSSSRLLVNSQSIITPHLICSRYAVWERVAATLLPSALGPWTGLVPKETYPPRVKMTPSRLGRRFGARRELNHLGHLSVSGA